MQTTATSPVRATLLLPMLLLACLVHCHGCAHGIISQRTGLARNAIPAHRLPDELAAPSKNNQVHIEFTQLRRPPVGEHLVGPGDVLGVYVEDVLSAENQLPAVAFPSGPVDEVVRGPLVGHPITVRGDGSLPLPLVEAIDVNNLTIPQIADKVRAIYVDNAIIGGNKHVTVDLIRPRTVNVIVVREDTGPPTESLIRREQQMIAKRGSARVLELPMFENDVLHALALTGGLPGLDGYNEVWVLRGAKLTEARRSVVVASLEFGAMPEEYRDGSTTEVTRIPLRTCRGQALPFSPEDVILNDGDVVFIESRETEYFTTGGNINGGKFPLPRDYDVDVLEAIAIANTNVHGPAGNATATNFRSGPGNIIAPTRAIVIRKLDSGEQIKIDVDVRAAMNDPNERIIIKSGDLIVLRYKPVELMGNIALNFVNVNYFFPRQ